MKIFNDDPLEYLIIGGGLHGVHMAVRLMGDLLIPKEKLKILDPGSALLEQWRHRTKRTGMKHLRSPSVHHLDLSPMSLKRYRSDKIEGGVPRSIPPYDRPALAIFNEHCNKVIEGFDLDQVHLKASAAGIKVQGDLVRVTTSTGTVIRARKCILAMGVESMAEFPSWVPKNTKRFHDIFQKEPLKIDLQTTRDVTVIGGGISAVQTALRFSGMKRRVTLIMRHDLRIHQFDSDPGWLGPKNMKGFGETSCLKKRREVIREARHRGSIPTDVERALSEAEMRGEIQLIHSQVQEAEVSESFIRLGLEGGETHSTEHVIFAGGLDIKRPGGALIDQLIIQENLPCSPCGYPKIDEALRWHPLIYVMGPLAELELGPVSRNIAGARRAAERITDSLLGNMNISSEEPAMLAGKGLS